MKKSQSSIEFIILISAILFFFIALLFTFNQKIADKNKEKLPIELKKTALSVQNEIALATKASNGYQRTFTLPETILNQNYTINITQDLLFIKTTDDKYALALPVHNISGNIQKGTNTIYKANSTIYLNP